LASRNRGILNLAIRLKDKTIIGFAQLARTDAAAAFMKGIAKDRSRWFEISYHLDPKYWSKGYGTEIVKALVDEAMANGAEGVYAQTNINNAASGRVLTRAGFNEFERMKFASMGAETGAIHYAVTREDWKKRPSGMEIEHTKDEYGKELMILRVHGQVPTWTVVEVDQKAIDSRQTPLPRLGKDRLVQLTSTSNGNQYLGVYISIPMNPYLSYFTSTLEIDRIFEEALFEGKFDRRFFDIRLTRELTNSRHGSLGYNPSELFPDNFLQLTIFEKRRIYEKLKGVIVMDEKARDIITRKSVIGTGEEN
jgi:RimJ/RimL family protein N-acetyltransferase